MALFFRNWIQSGVNKVSDLHFVDGKLNMKRMYDVIIFKHNILSELLTMRQALQNLLISWVSEHMVPYL